MTRQPDLFLPAVATVRTRQGELFDIGGRVVNLTCQECGGPMEVTPSGFLCCGRGHGRLFTAANDPANWLFFDEPMDE
jgi:hypothetical protein